MQFVHFLLSARYIQHYWRFEREELMEAFGLVGPEQGLLQSKRDQ